MKAAVLIFDVDGTLSNPMNRKVRALENVLGRKVSRRAERALRTQLGFGDALRLLGTEDKAKQKEIEEESYNEFFWNEELYDLDVPLKGAVETLQSLSEDYRIYYVSGRPIPRTVSRLLKRYDFPKGRIEAIFISKPGGDSQKKMKKFREIIRETRVRPENIVAVGDTVGDAIAAKKLKMVAVGICQFILVRKEELQKVCDYVIEKIEELPSLLARIESVVRS